jgi:hypothetical protein
MRWMFIALLMSGGLLCGCGEADETASPAVEVVTPPESPTGPAPPPGAAVQQRQPGESPAIEAGGPGSPGTRRPQ